MTMVVHVNDIPNLPPKVREMCEKRGITNMLVLAAQNAWEMRKYDISEEDIQWVFGLKEEVVRTHKHIPEIGSGFSTPNSHLVFCDTRRHKLEKVGFFEARAWYKEVAIKIANCEDGWRWGYDFYGGVNPSYFTNPLKSRRECLKEGCKFLLERAEEQLSNKNPNTGAEDLFHSRELRKIIKNIKTYIKENDL